MTRCPICRNEITDQATAHLLDDPSWGQWDGHLVHPYCCPCGKPEWRSGPQHEPVER